MDPTDFLNFAKKLRYSSDEASIRTAISRAYYYVYHYIKRELLIEDENFAHEHLHECIQEARIKGETMEEFRTLGIAIQSLKSRRILADYKIHKNITQITCDTMIDDCQEVIKEFEECTKNGLIEAAKDYLINIRKYPRYKIAK